MKRHASWALFVLLAVLYVAAGTWTTRRVGPTGDEPYYLLAADSLLHGEGFVLDGRWSSIASSGYDPGDHLADLPRQSSPSLRAPGHFPLHDLGLSMLLALPFAIGGRALAVACVGVAMAGAVALAHRAGSRLVSPRAAIAGALLGGLSVPALTYSGQLFPDSVMSLAMAAGLAALAGAAPLGVGVIGIAALPFLHVRGWPLAIALLLALGWGRSWRDRAMLGAPLLAVVIGSSLLDLAVYGVPLPHAGFLLFFTARPDTSIAAYASTTPFGVLGLLVDRAFGLLPAAPVALLAFVGAGVAARRRLVLPLLAIPYLLLASAVDWTGGLSPQARYLAPLVPLLVMLLALGVAVRPWRLALIALMPLTAAMSAVYVAVPGIRYDSVGVPPFADRTFDKALGGHLSGIFPLLGTDGATGLLLIGWATVLVLAVAAGAAARAVTRLSSSPGTMAGGADP
ncbi:MAG: hypothetical protein M3O64_04480 [Chloroflexota bacterium]|nr:hypothetical protein [Chloroflexota bacterium]